MKITKIFTFDAAHRLPNYEGKCQNLHGHCWKLEVSFEGEVNEETGMMIDFNAIANICDDIVEKLDHRLINELIPNPTAENMIKWIKDEIDIEINFSEFPKVCGIKLWETPTPYAEEIY